MKLRHALAVLVLVVAGARVSADDTGFKTAPATFFTVEHIALDLDVDLAGRSIAGHALLDVKAARDLNEIRLDAVSLQVTSVSANKPNAQPAPAPFTNDGESLEIKTSLKRGETARLKIVYSVRDPRAGLHFYGPSASEPDVPLQVWSQGEAQTNRYWVPCVDSPVNRQTSELTAHVPAGFEAVSNGKLVERADEDGGKKTRFHFLQDKNHVAYLISLVVGKFHVAKDEWRGKPLLYYVPASRKDDIERVFGHTKAMLDFFSDKIGVEYAWDKYSQTVVEQFGWGGMENVSATTLNERTMHDARAHLDYDSDGLVSHELAHQWWGDLLTCRDWAHIWLNEGFASYFEALWDEKQNGPDEFEYNMFEKSRGATDARCKEKPVVDHFYGDPESVFDSRAYPKGAWVLHGLRRRVGDEAFWRTIKRYATENKFKTVETVDLRRAFEAETGESLERYFYDLTARPGHPALEVSYDWKDGVLEAVVKQNQAGDAFAIRTTILADKTEIPVRMTDEKEKRIVVALPARPRLVQLDPAETTLKELVEHKGEDQWRAQLAEGANPVGRIRAAMALADTRQPHNIEAVVKAALEDKQWFVASEAAKALGRAGGDVARDGLVRLLAHAKPQVRRSALESLGNFHRDEKAIAAVKAIVEKGDASYYAEAAAVGAYGRLGAADAKPLLEKALERDSHNDVIRENALGGLAALEDPGVFDKLEAVVTKGSYSYNVRRHAIGAWARVAALPEVDAEKRKRCVTTLTKLAEEGGIRVRWAAIDALGGLGKEALASLAALDAVSRHDGEGRIRDAAKRAADRVRAGTPASVEVTKLRDELQRLKDSERKLVERLERVEAKAAQPPAAPAKPAGGSQREPD
ncbi:MAG: M1 family aminopeptidase [Planctomycetota bacterium]